MDNRFEISLVTPIPSGMYIGIEQDLKFCVIKNEKNLKKVRFITINRPPKLTESPMNIESQRILKNLKFFVVFFQIDTTTDQLEPISGIKIKNYALF